MRLNISSLDEFRSHVAHKEEVRESVIGPNLVNFCYMISNSETFDSPWVRECRGIVFNTRTGHVVSRPLHKFHNMNERDGWRIGDFQWWQMSRVMDKRDGSMIQTVITPAPVNGHRWYFDVKTKKSFNSDVAIQARKFIFAHPHVADFCHDMGLRGITAIFEYTAPDARIVLPYEKPELVLLHLRNNRTGMYYDLGDIKSLTEDYGIPVVGRPDFDIIAWNKCRDEAERQSFLQNYHDTAENQEGLIFQFTNGEMVKVKTKWYIDRHHVMTFLRERDVVAAILDETIDDMKSVLQEKGVKMDDIEDIERRVAREILDRYEKVENFEKKFEGLSDKEIAMTYRTHPLFAHAMRLHKGQYLNLNDWYRKEHLRKWSLTNLVMVDEEQ